ncbi:transmembrane protein 45B-like [Ptychodera flava]|uniref:transmembrane protein 45B-like n=1 Tax=Ptychodera flava TaxID=63121 RepID=UPI00396A9D54
MGTFEGHALPGSFFLVFSIWWTIKYSYRFIQKSSNPASRRRKTENSSNGKWTRRIGRVRGLPAEFYEGLIIAGMCLVGFICEQSWPYKKWEMFSHTDPNHRFVNGAEWQHCTMYVFFGIYGSVLVMARTCVPGLQAYEMLFLALSYFVEGLFFYFHVHGRTPLDISVHYMLVIGVAVSTLCAVVEIWKKDDVLLPFVRVGFTMVQGTWFWQVGFMLYPLNGGHWDEDNHANVMFATMAFCWHIAAAIFVMAGIYGIVSLCLRTRGVYSVPYANVNEEVEVGLMNNDQILDELSDKE